jgi:hypothetical protein
MASLPPSQRPSQSSARRSSQSSSPRSNPASHHSPRDGDLVLTAPPAQSSAEKSSQSGTQSPALSAARAIQENNDARRCWICYSDETEDTPTSSAWRSPCPCALTAHEACILDWIADLEANGKSNKVQCPQCKADIVVARSGLVTLIRRLEGYANLMVLPTIAVIGGYIVIYLSVSYGVVAVSVVLGEADFNRIFVPGSRGQAIRKLLGLATVPWMLILSRIRVADSILPIVPMLFFATEPNPDALTEFTSWPPSAGLSFALLPFLRSAYFYYYDHFWLEKERQWIDDVRPRRNTDQRDDQEGQAGGDAGGAGNGAGGGGFELEIALGDIMDDEDEGNVEGDANAEHIQPPQFEQLGIEVNIDNNGQAEVEVVQQVGPDPQAAAPAPNVERRPRPQYISFTRIVQNVIGALAFPSVSAAMGGFLEYALPRSWTQLGAGQTRPTRFLQTRWGRCIVGGCLFVVLKDAMTLYVRWKLSQSHKQRRVLDYDREKVRGNASGKR